MITRKRVLVLSPHTDDGELGAGGTVARWLDEGSAVHTATFSSAEASLPPGSPRDTLAEENRAALDTLGVPVENRRSFDYPVREFGSHRQAVLDDLVRLSREVEPDVVLVPAGADLHQDHAVVHREALRAFKHVTVMGYEMPWNTIAFACQGFVVLERAHVDRKWAALSRYRSQIELGRPYFRADFVESLARVRGVQMRAEFAEAFEMVRVRL